MLIRTVTKETVSSSNRQKIVKKSFHHICWKHTEASVDRQAALATAAKGGGACNLSNFNTPFRPPQASSWGDASNVWDDRAEEFQVSFVATSSGCQPVSGFTIDWSARR